MERIKYRKWTDPDGQFEENYLMIHPSGLMLQISFENDIYGKKCLIYQTKPLNPLNEKIFLKHKEICSKSDWVKAQKRAGCLLKAQLVDVLTK